MSELTADATRDPRTMVLKRDLRVGRRWCPYCPKRVRATHLGLANGLAMTTGCEWHIRMWVRDPHWNLRRKLRWP